MQLSNVNESDNTDARPQSESASVDNNLQIQDEKELGSENETHNSDILHMGQNDGNSQTGVTLILW